MSSTHLPLQILCFLVLLPATQATKYWGSSASSTIYRSNVMAFAIFSGRCGSGHCRIFYSSGSVHKVPFLWRFHAVHQLSPLGKSTSGFFWKNVHKKELFLQE
jgi:hypothetical protein